MTMDWQDHRFVFIGGLHRSGTTLLARCLAEHPEVSGFSGTRALEDEGQHLQNVYQPGRAYGGPGRFGFDPEAHLTETSSLVEHWLHCHELMLEDAGSIDHMLVMRYEEFVSSPDERLADVYRFLGLEPRPSGLHVRTDINDSYFRRWSLARHKPGTGSDIEKAMEELEERVGRFGYSLQRPQTLTPLQGVV
jgi:hypothetical protein